MNRSRFQRGTETTRGHVIEALRRLYFFYTDLIVRAHGTVRFIQLSRCLSLSDSSANFEKVIQRTSDRSTDMASGTDVALLMGHGTIEIVGNEGTDGDNDRHWDDEEEKYRFERTKKRVEHRHTHGYTYTKQVDDIRLQRTKTHAPDAPTAGRLGRRS